MYVHGSLHDNMITAGKKFVLLLLSFIFRKYQQIEKVSYKRPKHVLEIVH